VILLPSGRKEKNRCWAENFHVQFSFLGGGSIEPLFSFSK